MLNFPSILDYRTSKRYSHVYQPTTKMAFINYEDVTLSNVLAMPAMCLQLSKVGGRLTH